MTSQLGVRFNQYQVVPSGQTARNTRWRLFFDDHMGTFVLKHWGSGEGWSTHGMTWVLVQDIEKAIRESRYMCARVKGRLIRKARRICKMLVPVDSIQ